MPSDNVQANQSTTSGAVFRTFADSGSVEWPASVVCFAPTISAGANILQPVNSGNPLPVFQTGPLAAGTNSIGTVVIGAGSAAIGSVILGAGAAAIGSVSVSNFPATQAVSGTISTNADASVGAGTAPSKALAIAGVYNSAAPSPTTGQTVALQLDSAGNLKVVSAGGGSNAAAGSTGSAVPSSADYSGLNVAGNLRGRTGVNPSGSIYAAQTDLSSVGGASLAFGQAVMASSLPVVISSNQSAIPVSGTFFQATQPISAVAMPLPTGASTAAKQPALGTPGTAATDVISVQGIASMTPLSVSGTFWQTTQPISGTVTVNALPVGTNSIGTVQPGNTPNTTPWLVTDTPGTVGGLSSYNVVAAASNNAASVKASAGQLFHISAFNNSGNIAYLKLYDKATSPAPGTDTPKMVFLIPANTSGAGASIALDKGVSFASGIAIAIVGGIAENDNTSVAATSYVVNIGYK